MKKFYFLITIIFIVVIGSLIYKSVPLKSDFPVANKKETYTRIISLSPNITEILFGLELEKNIVGVTTFCSFPEAAKKISKVGGYFDPNFEAILLLEPDIVLILPEHENSKNFLSELEIEYLITNNKTISDISSTIEILGKQFGKEKQAERLTSLLQDRIEKLEKKAAGLTKPEVLISVGRTLGTGGLADVYAAGKDTYFDELINLAGGKNVVEIDNIAYPLLSAEGIIHLNPDIIVDFATDFAKQRLNESQVIKDWECLPDVNAVKNNRIYIRGQSYAVIPGPRFIILLEDLAQIFHPQLDWKEK